MVPGAGLEPDSSQNESLSCPGRNLTDSGQDGLQVGHHQKLAQGSPVKDGTLTVLTPTRSRTLGEHNTSITEHNRSITESAPDRGLQTVMNAWLRLPEGVRAGIVAMVKACDPQRKP